MGEITEKAGSARETRAGGRTGPRAWKDYVKRSACWGASALALLAIALLSSGSVAAATGRSITVLALLACPLSMYFMMRSMSSMNHTGQGLATKADADTPASHDNGRSDVGWHA